MRTFAVCPECFEPHPAGQACPACSGFTRTAAAAAAPAPTSQTRERARRVAGVVALGVLGLGLTAFCLLALRYFVAT